MEISLAKESDMMDIFELANDPLVRQNSFNQSEIEIEGHKKWFLNGLENQNCYFYIIRENLDLIGSVRFDLAEKNHFIIGIQISKNYRGKGLASKIIIDTSLKLLEARKDAEIIAHIKENNEGSLRAFLKAGYKIISNSQKNNFKFYILKYENRK
jgi:UDP-2,4-diacetamido-2,4,6-trideoxy-beta-L-altropyranose hydrolase